MTPHAQISANQAIRLPDWMSPNPGYVIETSGAGTEGLLCLATDKDNTNELPESLSGPALRPLAGIRQLADVLALYKHTLGTEGYTTATVTWDVIARKAPTTTLAKPAPTAETSTKR